MHKSLCILILVIYLVNCKHSDNRDVCDKKIRVTALPDKQNNFLVSLLWDSPTKSFFGVDVISPAGVYSIYRYHLPTYQIYGAVIEGEVNPSFIWPIEDCKNQYIVGIRENIKLVEWDGVSETATVIRSLYEVYGTLEYALADRAGRFYFGTFNHTSICSAGNDYALYCYDKGRVRTVLNNTKTTTGLAIDYKRKKFYHADCCNYRLDEFDYDPKTGDISNRRLVYDFKKSGLNPYPLAIGLEVDKNGRLYVTLYKSGQMWIIDSKTGKVLRKIKFLSPGLTDVVFAGRKLKEAYVLTARVLQDEFNGSIIANRTRDRIFFRVEGLCARGYETPRVRLDRKDESWHPLSLENVKEVNDLEK